jgi:outer membrane protein assembly factor BamB
VKNLILAVAVLLGCGAASAQDWPQFRGPDGQGHAGAQPLPIEWSESKNVAWKSPIAGLGWSSPVVFGGRVWITTSVEQPLDSARDRRGVSLRAIAFDAETGREIVNVEVFRIPANRRDINPKNSWASPTPIIERDREGDRIYVHFGADGTAALTATGEIVWKARFDYQSQHGAGGSPVLHGDLLIINCDGSDTAFVVALDKRTGKVKWRRDRAYDPLTGREIWRVRYDQGFSNVPRPVFGHGMVFIATGFQEPSLMAVRIDGTGDVTKTHVAWTLKRGAPLTPSPLLVGDELYLVNDGGIATCVDARTGNVIWQSRLGGTYSASPVFAGGHIYFQAEQGVTSVIAPGKEARRVAANKLDGGLLASMAVAGQAIFLRTDTHLYKIAQPAGPAEKQ